MLISQLTTDRAADVLIELTPYIANIVKDEILTNTLGKTIDTEGMSRIGIVAAGVQRLSDYIPFLLKDHRSDLYGILSILNEKTAKEIAAQNIMQTISMTKEVLQDKDLIDFFKSFMSQEQNE